VLHGGPSDLKKVDPLNILIVCHAGRLAGLGHLTRALVVARALKKEIGAEVKILIQGDRVSIDSLDEFDHRFLTGYDSLGGAIYLWSKQLKFSISVFDLYSKQMPADIDSVFLNLKNSGSKLVAIDSLEDHSLLLDLIFMPSFSYRPPKNSTCIEKFVYGWDCFLFEAIKHETVRQSGRNLLVLTGGSDVAELGKYWPQELNKQLPLDCVLNWVTGPFAKSPVWPEDTRIRMRNHQSPSRLGDLMATADYAITVYGVSFYELLSYGVPTIVFSPYGDKDCSDLNAISDLEIALVAKDTQDAIAKFEILWGDKILANNLSFKSHRQMSISGGQRFVGCIKKILEQ
jgi:spore coat polysaccharide biosynthesis predicted glycosyltransferase SpsG